MLDLGVVHKYVVRAEDEDGLRAVFGFLREDALECLVEGEDDDKEGEVERLVKAPRE